jgi:SNF2 family DNA or RNA helicase
MTTVPDWPPGAAYWSPRSIPFQVDMVARSWVLRQMMICADLGTGKSHIALMMLGLAFELDEADVVLIVCKRNKLAEWMDDLATFTSLSHLARLYHGPRRKALLSLSPGILVTTYHAVRSDAVVPAGPKGKQLADGPLMEFLRGKRVLVFYDEITQLGNRSSAIYKVHHHVLSQLRKEHPDMRVYGLTGTPIEKDWENAFSEMRLVWPQGMPLVKDFEALCIRKKVLIRTGKSLYASYERIIWDEEGCRQFAARCAPRLLRKRKTDSDVASQFPPRTEEFVRCAMHADQGALYRTMEDLAWDEQGNPQAVPGLGMMLMLAAGHPKALLNAAANGRSKLATLLRETIGDQISACSSAKTEMLTDDYLDLIVRDQGSKAIVFTFFASTVLPALHEILEPRYPVFVYDGGPRSEGQKREFRSFSGGAVLLASDAGSDGINIPEADYVIEYESAREHSVRTQRFGRADRLGRVTPLTCLTFVLEGTVEESRLIPRLLERNEQQDIFLGDEEAEGHLTAEERREMFAISRKRRKKA